MAANQRTADAVAITNGIFHGRRLEAGPDVVARAQGRKSWISKRDRAARFVEPHMHFIYEILIANVLSARYPQITSLDAFLAALKAGLGKVHPARGTRRSASTTRS